MGKRLPNTQWMNNIHNAAALIGSMGGKAGKGSAKARGSDVMSRAGKMGWVQRRVPMPDKFWMHVGRGRNDECWPWAHSSNAKAYGVFILKKKHILAHRMAWSLAFGTIPNGMLVCHRCDNPPCCNPGHLFLGTDKDNMSDCIQKGRRPSFAGTKNGRAKLNDQSVAEIKKMHSQGMTYPQIAKAFGITVPAARYANLGITWKHLVS